MSDEAARWDFLDEYYLQGRGIDIVVAECFVCGAVVRKAQWERHNRWHDRTRTTIDWLPDDLDR